MSTSVIKLGFEAIGTQWNIELPTTVGSQRLSTLQEKILERIRIFDRTYSRFRPDSVITQISKSSGRYLLPDDAVPLLTFYKSLYDVTDGKVTPMIGNAISDAGYDASYSLTPKAKISATKRWEEILRYDFPMLDVLEPVLLDFGAAGKGYLIDIIGRLLQDAGIHDFMIDAGGDLLRHTTENSVVKIGLENPHDPTEAIGVIELKSGSICGSATNRRVWAGLHHIFDPDSLRPVEGIAAIWVSASSALLADGIATALFFTSANVLREHYDFEYLIVRADRSFEKSDGLQAEMFTLPR